MFDVIRKPRLWAALDAGLDREIGKPVHFLRKRRPWALLEARLGLQLGRPVDYSLKSVQDLAVYEQLRNERGKHIAEIGAGHSRLLPRLARANTCTSVEKFEGRAGGPTRARRLAGVRNVYAYLGEMSPELAADSLDFVFSISVVEHVGGTVALDAFHEDQLRILRPGGVFIHAIDMYLEQEPSAYQLARFAAYRSWVTSTPGVEPVGDVYEGACRFTCDMATTPDNRMYVWGRADPNLIELRQVAQSVSVLVAGRKL